MEVLKQECDFVDSVSLPRKARHVVLGCGGGKRRGWRKRRRWRRRKEGRGRRWTALSLLFHSRCVYHSRLRVSAQRLGRCWLLAIISTTKVTHIAAWLE
jgi:hypothetical protein